MKKILLIIILATMLIVSDVVLANDTSIECTTTVTEEEVYVVGRIPNVTEQHFVGLYVGDIDNILYIDQTTCDTNGNFSFYFKLPDSLIPGVYDVVVGTSADAGKYSGLLVYAPMEEGQFFDADVTVMISNYVPTITGTMSFIEGKTVTFTAVDKSDNTVIVQDTIISEDGSHNLSYALPSIITGRDYSATISCQEGDKTLFNVAVDINSSIILVSVDGKVQVADNVRLDARVKTTNSDLIDKSATITSNESISTTIPNLVANMSCDVSLKGFEKVKIVDYKTTIVEEDSIYCKIAEGNSEECNYSFMAPFTKSYYISAGDLSSVEVYDSKGEKVDKKTNSSNVYELIKGKRYNIIVSTASEQYVLMIKGESSIRNIHYVGIGTPMDNHITKLECFKINWITKTQSEQFYSANGNLYKFAAGIETKILNKVEAKFVVSDDNYIYFSDMLNDGNIYRCTKDGQEMTLICGDSASWLYIQNGYLYYTDNKDNRTEKQIFLGE